MAALLRIAAEASTSGGLLSSLRALPARTAWEHSQAASVRYFRGGSAALFAKAKAKGAKVAPEAPEVGMSATHCTGLNYTKGGSDPELGPDSDYPDWLWELTKPKKTLTMLEKEMAAAKLVVPVRYDIIEYADLKRLMKLRRRNKIKANNAARAKK
mmetsp:Transcript_2216/g.5213  ORF Transcript_2216/g.5213 Transcript_2216/m.5213 type:complete len:156 (-) Transcript_2216:188-655(-)